LIAPASLKHRQRVDRDVPERRFPGLDCPGLIEAELNTYQYPYPKSFPGLDCPGLIEADLAQKNTQFAFTVFRGLIAPASLKLPRPHQGRSDGQLFSGA